MKHIQWITEQMNKGNTWDELKNLTEEDFIEAAQRIINIIDSLQKNAK